MVPPGAQLVDDVADEAAANRVEPRGGLVEKDQSGLIEQRLGQADPLQHALGKRAQLFFRNGVSPTRSSSSANAQAQTLRFHAVELAVDVQELLGREPVVEAEVFRQEAHAATRFSIAKRSAEQGRAPRGRRHQAKQHFDRGGLACAVWAEEAKNLAVRDLQGQATHGKVIAIRLSQRLRFDGDFPWTISCEFAMSKAAACRCPGRR